MAKQDLYQLQSEANVRQLIIYQFVGSVMAERAKASFLLRSWSRFNVHSGHVVESLDKTLYDDNLCLVVSNTQQIYVSKSQTSIGKLGLQSTPERVKICSE